MKDSSLLADDLKQTATPQERILIVLRALIESQLSLLSVGKRFIAQQAFDILFPSIEERIKSMSQGEVSELVETTREMMARISDVIENGLSEAAVTLGE